MLNKYVIQPLKIRTGISFSITAELSQVLIFNEGKSKIK
jgi:hypothetical protein